MRTTLNLDDALLDRARQLTGIHRKTALLHAALEALIARESAKRLAALGQGSFGRSLAKRASASARKAMSSRSWFPPSGLRGSHHLTAAA